MNKNLKKVISAVAALAMSASSFVALAANYPDVDASASYKQAIDELSALKVIEGYEDGTFQPDKLVTRAEFSKMVITALGSAELAQAEAAAGRDTQFKDVTGSHWAAGYVTAAVAQSIINGMGDGTFAPDANVTYAQAMKMLVCAAGYEQWSVDHGGWPDGYMYYGNQLKVGNGVKDVTDATEITRAQVAQMIDNILNAPVCVDTHEYAYDAYGNRYAKLEQMNGTGKNFESILIKNHDTYKVKGMVMDTNRSSDGAIKVDEVKFEIQNATRWLDESKAITKSNALTITAKVGDTDVADYLKQYVEIMVREDDDEEYTVLAVATAGQTDENVEAADDYDADKTAANDGRLYFYSNGRSKSYKIDDETELYVNGVKTDDFADGVAKYVDGNTASDVTLVDVPESGSTDGIIDLVYVNFYDTAIVDAVSKLDSDKPALTFTAYTHGASNKIEFDTTDKTKSYSIVDTEGKAMELSDIQENDVVSIQRNVFKSFKESEFYDLTVSRNTAEGRPSLYDEEEEEYEINGERYSVISDMVDNLDQSATYTLYFDAFGRIAYTDETAVNKNIAILDAVYLVRGSEYEATLILKDGTSKDYILRKTTTNVKDSEGNDLSNYDLASTVVYGKKIADKTAGDGKLAIQKRVIEYTVNNSDELTIKNVLAPETANGEFRASTSRLDGFSISEDVTSFLSAPGLDVDNAVTDEKVAASSYSSLVDNREYDAYLFDRSNSDSTYRFVILTSGAGTFSPDTELAVYVSKVSTQDSNDNTVTALNMLVGGEEKQYFIDDAYDAPALTAGEPVIFETNSTDEITNIVKVSNLEFKAGGAATYEGIRAAAVDGTTDGVITLAKNAEKDKVEMLSSTDDRVDVIFGVVTDRSSGSITLNQVNATKSVVNEEKTYSLDSDAVVYVYDSYESKASKAVSVGTTSDITSFKIPNAAYTDSTKKEFNWTYGDDAVVLNPSFAIIRTVNKYVQEVYVINPND